MTGRAPHQGAQSQGQFLDPKWFCQKVICSGFERGHFFWPTIARRENENR